MQERALKTAVVALTALLAIVVAAGAILVASTQNGNTIPTVEAVFHEPVGNFHSSTTLYVDDKMK